MPYVTVNEIDIYEKYVEQLQDISKSKTFDKLTLQSNQYNIPVKNIDNQWSVNNPDSFFSGGNWLYSPVVISTRENIIDFRGVLVRVPRDHGRAKAKLIIKDSFYKYRDSIVSYVSSDWETGASAFLNICESVGYTDYDVSSQSKSDSILTSKSCFMKCNFNFSEGVTFQQAINTIALYSNSYAYIDNNKMYFVTWEYPTGANKFTINNNDLKMDYNVDEDITSIYNDYEISYYNDLGVPALDSANNSIGQESRTRHGNNKFVIRGDNESQIIIKDLTSAVYIGENKIRRSHRNLLTDPMPLSFINFSVKKDFEGVIDINTYFNINVDREGWTDKLMEPFRYTASQNTDNISILAYEVPTE